VILKNGVENMSQFVVKWIIIHHFVAVLPATEGLAKSLDELVDWSIKSINQFSMSYDEVARQLGLIGISNTNKEPSSKIVKIEKQDSIPHIYDYYESKGFFFSKEILTRYFLSLKTKPFVILTGISGTGKTKIAQIFADYICQDNTPEERGKRIAFVPVKPDWMDNKGLLGYYNLLDEKYHVTPVLRLLLEAQQHPEKPYFIILDEMNLAKVEQYFSDFLSIIESRTQDKPDGEVLHLHSAGTVRAQDGGGDVPTSFHIPANVYFTGTVNIDESTYMFSSKVLDRANVIEFNDVNLADYEKGVVASDGFVLKEADVRNGLLPGEDEVTFSSKADYSAALKITPELHDYLDGLLNILRHYHLHFGYRVINEIAHYIRHAHELIRDFDLEEAMDIQILQKILPKFHGTQGKLEEPLNRLFEFCIAEDARFPRSAQKLERMLYNLKVQGYTSFIE
jgi:5-methylcytosine-specific restriction endonuclease McrBC GTP-binding regulatory subunit McrB